MERIHKLLTLLQQHWPPENLAQVPRIVATHKNVLTLFVHADGGWHEFTLSRSDWLKDPIELAVEITRLMEAKSA